MRMVWCVFSRGAVSMSVLGRSIIASSASCSVWGVLCSIPNWHWSRIYILCQLVPGRCCCGYGLSKKMLKYKSYYFWKTKFRYRLVDRERESISF